MAKKVKKAVKRETRETPEPKISRATVVDFENKFNTPCDNGYCPDHVRKNIVSLRCACHPETGFTVTYFRGEGDILLTCAACASPVLKIGVALI